VVSKQIMRTSKMVSKHTGMAVQPNKAITGANAFAHEAGIHQDGVLKHAATYEIMKPESVGITTQLVMGKHSGKHAFRDRLVMLHARPGLVIHAYRHYYHILLMIVFRSFPRFDSFSQTTLGFDDVVADVDLVDKLFKEFKDLADRKKVCSTSCFSVVIPLASLFSFLPPF
jgi:hypothetical protein